MYRYWTDKSIPLQGSLMSNQQLQILFLNQVNVSSVTDKKEKNVWIIDWNQHSIIYYQQYNNFLQILLAKTFKTPRSYTNEL